MVCCLNHIYIKLKIINTSHCFKKKNEYVLIILYNISKLVHLRYSKSKMIIKQCNIGSISILYYIYVCIS